MASHESFVEFIVDQISDAGRVRYLKMFGEYAIYCNDKVVALICDDQLYVKSTDGGKAYIGKVTEAPPYPGAKLSFLIKDEIENSEWLTELIRITASELPKPKLKLPKKVKSKK
ncbi:MAG: TfoX/Sxy family protein [Oligoflexia bacterium]|nr:TfoX/Sxy family protein [Oligoflexia bacterium]